MNKVYLLQENYGHEGSLTWYNAVIGIYATEELAQKAKDIQEQKNPSYDEHDGVNYLGYRITEYQVITQ